MHGFIGELFRVPGKGGWTFVAVPPEHVPEGTGPWGRVPVRATVDGQTWDTSIWKEASGRVLLAVPTKVRRGKEHGDTVRVALDER